MTSGKCRDIARLIDHSLLHPAMTESELVEGTRAAAEWGVASVCVKPYFVARARVLLTGSAVNAGTTVGFPHGGHASAAKLAEARQALEDGAQEIDMVVNIGKVLSADWGYVEDEIGAIVGLGHEGGALVKVIFENCYLEEGHKRRLSRMSREVGADFIKTSTGYGSGGASEDDLRLMLEEAGPKMGVKAAGGIRSYDQLLHLRELGVRRFGLSQTERMLAECRRETGGS